MGLGGNLEEEFYTECREDTKCNGETRENGHRERNDCKEWDAQ
jgi:hypothetical protein